MPSGEAARLSYRATGGVTGEETASGRVQKNKAIVPPTSRTDESRGWRFNMTNIYLRTGPFARTRGYLSENG
jgi:hypothetical protein